jgi:predicted phosphodiesterase
MTLVLSYSFNQDKPQKLAIISDIHSNLEAFRAVLDKIQGLPILCLGDVVGYGGSPNEVVENLAATGAACIQGNHDWAVLQGDFSDFNSRAAIALKWTADQLTARSRTFLGSMMRDARFSIDGLAGYATHGSPDDRLWEYVHPATHSELFRQYLQTLHVQILALGHTHIPFVWQKTGGTVFNPGSVGQPRTGDSRAAYALLEARSGSVIVKLENVEYDVQVAAKRILDAGLPDSLAGRLLVGR